MKSLAAYERDIRREQRCRAHSMGRAYPHLRTIGQVIIPSNIPEWAIAWALPGLTITNTSIWLTKKRARDLFKRATADGLSPQITYTPMRPCRICRRILLGLDAEHRWSLDRKYGGDGIPCDPACAELQWERIDAKKSPKVRLTVANQKRNGRTK